MKKKEIEILQEMRANMEGIEDSANDIKKLDEKAVQWFSHPDIAEHLNDIKELIKDFWEMYNSLDIPDKEEECT